MLSCIIAPVGALGFAEVHIFVCIVFLFCASPGFHFQSICMVLLVLRACYVGVDAVSGLVILDKSVWGSVWFGRCVLEEPRQNLSSPESHCSCDLICEVCRSGDVALGWKRKSGDSFDNASFQKAPMTRDSKSLAVLFQLIIHEWIMKQEEPIRCGWTGGTN